MKKIFFLFFLLICSDIIYPQSDKYFVKTFGTDTTFENPFKIFQLPDQGYIFISYKYNFFETYACGFLILINKYGDIIRKMEYCSDSGRIYPRDIRIIANTYYITGEYQNRTSGIYYTWLQKTDTAGNLLWYKTMGDSLLNGVSYCIEPTFDGSFMFAGLLSGSDTLGYLDALTLKIDSSGNLKEVKTYGQFGNNDAFVWVEQTSDSGFVYVGSWGFIIDASDMWLLKTDKNGNTLWDRKYSYGLRTGGSNMRITSDNGFIVSGSKGPYMEEDGFLVKLDSTGNYVWFYGLYSDDSIPQPSELNMVEQLKDGSFVALGSMEIRHGFDSDWDMVLVKVSSEGNEIWRRYFSNMKDENDMGYHFSVTDDGGFIICGRTEITPDSGSNIVFSDAMIIKTNCAGFTGPPLAYMSIKTNGDTVSVTDTSFRADSIRIDFGDGTPSYFYQAWVPRYYLKWASIQHKYSDTGTYVVTLIASACGEYDTLTQQITILATSIKPKELIKPEFEAKVIPNPFSDFINIEYPTHGSIGFELYDLTGRKKISFELQKFKQNIKITTTRRLNTNNLPPGIYIYRIENENGSVKWGKMVKL